MIGSTGLNDIDGVRVRPRAHGTDRGGLQSRAVSPVVSRQLVDVVDARSAARVHFTGVEHPLDDCTVAAWGLQTACSTPEDPFVAAEVCRLLPAHGLRLRRRRSPSGEVMPTEIGAVRVTIDGHRWLSTDLLLGLEVAAGHVARVAHHADFAAAVAGGVLTPADADEAMSTVHRVLGELVEHRHDPDRWIAHHGLPSLPEA